MAGGKICSRDLSAGPGSCWHWWESCPKSTRHCFIRFIRQRTGQQHGGSIDLEAAREWERERDKAREPQKSLDLAGQGAQQL